MPRAGVGELRSRERKVFANSHSVSDSVMSKIRGNIASSSSLCSVLQCDDTGFVSLRIVLCLLAGRGWVSLNLNNLDFSDKKENIPNI